MIQIIIVIISLVVAMTLFSLFSFIVFMTLIDNFRALIKQCLLDILEVQAKADKGVDNA